MHDTFLIQAICRQVEQIAEERGATKVLRIVLEVGNLSHFTAEHMQDTFQIFQIANPLLRHAQLEFHGSDDSSEVYLRDIELEIPD